MTQDHEKDKDKFLKERASLVEWLKSRGYIKSDTVANAVLKVPREEFVPPEYRDYTYLETPLPLPGKNATISCVHTYCIYYEALKLSPGDRFLEVGMGSGYGAALARELVGSRGRIVTVEIDEETYRFGKANLERLGYNDVITILDDGSGGYEKYAPYDKIAVTAACPEEPRRIIEQLEKPGAIIYPVGGSRYQYLMLTEVNKEGKVSSQFLTTVVYVPLRGKYGVSFYK
ncbi:MAG: protein-L-isoaspartate(D-aspartate) O-methyltransferase [Candidatus Methanomethylophilaceae archaeon]|nr:protein-L-isoaspartate(D-aspartate) O-methyltransferase [Candidatus Methanomethylophilaceae archaeon]MDI3542242.1 protein-L-isoaspartate(D-aspartate) O-methyltransferase [Candidatus Methanomethylophilaceae archaeon]HIJ00893.1 protein-L-isoaspartate O-methyltransferase [Candidatus Methanomethylophilaceae archaeon]